MSMSKEEQNIVNKLQGNGSLGHMASELWAPLLELPLGQWSKSFCENKKIASWFKVNLSYSHDKILFRWLVEKHLVTNTPIEELKRLLVKLEYKEYINRKIANGEYERTVDDALIISIYESKNEELIKWIKSYFPTPPQYYTTEKREGILNCSKEKMESELFETMMTSNVYGDPHKLLESHLDKKTFLKWRKAVNDDKPDVRNSMKMDFQKHFPEWIKKSMNDANTLYHPKCDQALAKRIMSMAKEINMLKTANHPVDTKSLTNVLDDALYSHSALEDLYMPRKVWSYRPNAVSLNLGSEKVAHSVHEDVILEFDLEKIVHNQPTAYFTQRDFFQGNDQSFSTVRLGKSELHFKFSIPDRNYNQKGACAILMWGEEFDAPQSSLTSDNLQDMQAILILNFFRFIDHPIRGDKDTSTSAKHIYETLATLSDEELKTFLTDIQENFTKTAQLHLYRTHEIDFNTLSNIRHKGRCYSISVPKLIEDLNAGNIDTLHVVRVMIPELLESKRFREYLLTKVTNEEAHSYLEDMSKLIATPERNVLAQKQFRDSVSTKINQIETEKYPALGYTRLLDPNTWQEDFHVQTRQLPDEINARVFEAAIGLAREKLLKYIDSDLRKQLEIRDLDYKYKERDYIPSSENGKHQKERAVLKTLFDECKALILEENKSKKSSDAFQEIKLAAGNIRTTNRPVEKLLSDSGFDDTLKKIGSKVSNEREPIFALKGIQLHSDLSDVRKEFIHTGNTSKFVDSVKESVKKSDPVLKKSPVWKQFMLDILNAAIFILTLGISYMATGRVRLFSVQQRKESEVDGVNPPRENQP